MFGKCPVIGYHTCTNKNHGKKMVSWFAETVWSPTASQVDDWDFAKLIPHKRLDKGFLSDGHLTIGVKVKRRDSMASNPGASVAELD